MKYLQFLFFLFSLVYLLYSFFAADCAVTYEDRYSFNFEKDSIHWAVIKDHIIDSNQYVPFCDLSLRGKTYEQVIAQYGLPSFYENAKFSSGPDHRSWLYERGDEIYTFDSNEDEAFSFMTVPMETKILHEEWELDSLSFLKILFMLDYNGFWRCKHAYIRRYDNTSPFFE